MSDGIERLLGSVPGPRTAELARNLHVHESHNVTHIAEDFPVFWESARGALVTDVDGNRYIDLTAAFGVANTGHANRSVVARVREQIKRLVHAMGDVHPSPVRAELLARLAQIVPHGLQKTFLATTGSEAIEAALKTAILATGKARFVTYHGAYHGLSFGALAVGGIERFREPFEAMLGGRPLLLEYPHRGAIGAAEAAAAAASVLRAHPDVAALLIEPIQGRGGCVVPPDGYLAAIRELCDERGVIMIVDEIFTGFGRTGAWFACDLEGVTPDILCIGKAMGSGFPISATVGRSSVMDAWPRSTGEALHTSTYLGNPVGCAAALATIDELERLDLPRRARELGEHLGARLDRLRSHPTVAGVRGRGLLWGVQFRDPRHAGAVVVRALQRGVILLQAGSDGDVITIAPPLVITKRQLDRAVDILDSAVGDQGSAA